MKNKDKTDKRLNIAAIVSIIVILFGIVFILFRLGILLDIFLFLIELCVMVGTFILIFFLHHAFRKELRKIIDDLFR